MRVRIGALQSFNLRWFSTASMRLGIRCRWHGPTHVSHAYFADKKSHSVSFKEYELKVLVFLICSKCPRIISALVVVLISSLSIEIPGTWHVPKLPEPRKTSQMPTLHLRRQRKNLESKTVPGTTMKQASLEIGNVMKCVAFPILNSELD